MIASRLGIVVAVSILAFAAGCSDDDSPDDGDGGSSGSAASGGSGGAAGSSGNGGSGASGGVGGSAGASAGGSAGAGAGGSAGASAGGSAGASGGSSGTGGVNASGSVSCETKSCPLPAEFCCALYNQPDACMKPGATCFPGVDVFCDGPEDCGSGQVCCGQMFVQGQNKSYVEFSCEATCDASDQRVICGASGSCPGGKSCGPSELLPQYNDCK